MKNLIAKLKAKTNLKILLFISIILNVSLLLGLVTLQNDVARHQHDQIEEMRGMFLANRNYIQNEFYNMHVEISDAKMENITSGTFMNTFMHTMKDEVVKDLRKSLGRRRTSTRKR